MRMDSRMAGTLAHEFVRSRRSKLWWEFTDDLRNALLDALIMDHVRMASAVAADAPFTASDLCMLRQAVLTKLRRGISRGRLGKIHFWLDADTGKRVLLEEH